MPHPLLQQGYKARSEQRIPEAHRLFTEALAQARASNDPTFLAQSLTALGQAERDLQNHAAAQHHYEEAVDLYRTLNDPLKLASTIRHLADILRNRGLLVLSEPHYLSKHSPSTEPTPKPDRSTSPTPSAASPCKRRASHTLSKPSPSGTKPGPSTPRST